MSRDTERLVASSPRDDRRARERVIAVELARALADAELSDSEAARICGVRRHSVAAWRDPDSVESIPMHAVLALPPPVRTRLARVIAESLGCDLAERPSEIPTLDGDRELLAVSVERGGRAAAEWARALRDQIITVAEAHSTLRAATEAVESHVALMARCRTVIAMGGAREE